MSQSSRFWLAFFCALLLLSSSAALQGQTFASSSLTLDPLTQALEPLWTNLYEMSLTLPPTFDSFMDSLTFQISSLQGSNGQLSDSNSSLLLQNADLLASLKLSQARAAMFESKSMRLQTDLSASISSTIQVENDLKAAQVDANTLGLQNGWLEAGAIALTVIGADLLVKVLTGKDVIEWAITLFKK